MWQSQNLEHLCVEWLFINVACIIFKTFLHIYFIIVNIYLSSEQPNGNDSTEEKNAQHVQNSVSNEPPKVK